jgi:uncharacterized membrane-anchored protein YhcB (DUF1043 family)
MVEVVNALVTVLGGLWAGFVVYRLETAHSNMQELRERVQTLETKLDFYHDGDPSEDT